MRIRTKRSQFGRSIQRVSMGKKSPKLLTLLGVLLVATVTVLLLIAIPKNHRVQSSQTPGTSVSNFVLTTQVQDMETISEGISEGLISMGNLPSVAYLHCGPTYSDSSSDSESKELVLLHGARFTKDTWVEANILPTLCQSDKSLSVTSVDFPVVSNGSVLKTLFDNLAHAKITSGNPLIIVSPSASGRSVVGLLGASKDDPTYATTVMNGWIPVACGYIDQAPKEDLQQINALKLPVLAIYGNKDPMGKQVSERLTEIDGNKNVEAISSPRLPYLPYCLQIR